jgi:hypothetical protein
MAASDSSHARRRGPSLVERLAVAQKIYVVPVDEHAYEAVLEIRKGSRRTGGETRRLRETVADPAAFRKFNEALLEKAKTMFGEDKVEMVPKEYKRTAERRGVEYSVYDELSMDCDFFIKAELGRPDKPREAVYLLTDFDMEEEYIWIAPFGPYAAISLHEKVKKNKLAKKLFSATGTLVGVRDVERVGERGLDRAVNGHVPGERYPRYEDVFRVLETDSLYWTAEKHAANLEVFEGDFQATVKILTRKIPDRLNAALAKFELLAKKKMRPRRR